MWIIGVCFCLLGSGLNTLYTFRKPSIMLSQSAIQLLAYPIGKAWEKIVPDWTMNLFGRRVQLNPGPFNHKVRLITRPPPFQQFMTDEAKTGKHADIHHGQPQFRSKAQC